MGNDNQTRCCTDGMLGLMLNVTMALGLLLTSAYSYSSEFSRNQPVSGYQAFQCFPGNERTKWVLEEFFSSVSNIERDAGKEFVDHVLSAETVRALDDVADSTVCSKLSEHHADVIVARQVDVASESDKLDREAYAYDFAYYKSGDLYFFVLVEVPPAPKDKGMVGYSTSYQNYVVVYDLDVNKIGIYNADGDRLD